VQYNNNNTSTTTSTSSTHHILPPTTPIFSRDSGAWISEITFCGPNPALRLSRLCYPEPINSHDAIDTTTTTTNNNNNSRQSWNS